MQVKDVTVRVQSLDGVWETLGVDRAQGIWPEGVQLAADRWGPSSASCDLHRDPGASWPDIGAFTPIEFEVGGVVVWSGRVKETPSRDGSDRVLSVQCEGMQYHLDDDQYERIYAQTKLGAFKDGRQYLTTDLTGRTQAWQVQTGDGAIIIGFPTGSTVAANTSASVILDLGPSSAAKRVVLRASGGAWTPGGAGGLRLRGGSVDSNPTAYAEDFLLAATLPSAAVTYGVTFTTPQRYVEIIVANGGAAAGGSDAITFVRIESVLIVADTAYESGNASILKAPQVINDALDRATILLSSDRSQIDPTGSVTFSIPEFAPTDPLTPRQAIDAVNAYHNYVTAVDAQRRMVFAPQPAAPQWEVGAWSGMDFQDASANSGDDIYNRVIVTGQTPAGEPLRVSRSTGQGVITPGTQEVISSPSLSNPSFAVDATGWTSPTGQAITRDTTTSGTAPASGVVAAAQQQIIEASFTGTFRAGLTYVLTFAVLGEASSVNVRAAFGVLGTATSNFNSFFVPGADEGRSGIFPLSTVWQKWSVGWAPNADTSSAKIRLLGVHGSPGFRLWVDSFELSVVKSTLIDRRGFRRTMTLPINSALPSDGIAAAQIGDVWLKGHQITPFKGSVSLTGDAVRDILTGQRVPLERLLLAPQALLRFSDRSNPDDGSHGRDGRIASVTYTPATDEASVAIDNTRANFETLLSRLAVISGG